MEGSIAPHLIKAPIIGKDKTLNLNRTASEVYHWSRAINSSKVTFKATGKELFLHLSPKYMEGEGEVGQLKVSGKKLFVRCSDQYVQIKDWFYPTKKALSPGIFIAENIKSGKYSEEELRL